MAKSNPYAQSNGMPLPGKLEEFFNWEKNQAQKRFDRLSPERKKEVTKAVNHMEKKMNPYK